MPVSLLPPITSSGGTWSGQRPLTSGPRYVRGAGNSRWHRARSAVTYPDGRTIYAFWCGYAGTDGGKYGPLWLVDEPPVAEPVCGTCVGRALGAGQDETPAGLPPLRFDPRWLTPPALCPGSGSDTLLVELSGGRCARCLACGDIHRTRAAGGPYRSRWGLAKHPPGPDLVPACSFHGWMRIALVDGRAACACGYPAEVRAGVA